MWDKRYSSEDGLFLDETKFSVIKISIFFLFAIIAQISSFLVVVFTQSYVNFSFTLFIVFLTDLRFRLY